MHKVEKKDFLGLEFDRKKKKNQQKTIIDQILSICWNLFHYVK